MDYSRIKRIQNKHKYTLLPVKVGQLLEIYEVIGEGDNKRTQRFRGIVIKIKKPQHHDGTFTIRGLVAGNMVEKIYPLSFPKFDRVLLLDQYKVRRSKLYYLRTKIGKQAKLKSILGKDKKGIDLVKLALEAVSDTKNKEESQPETTEKKESPSGINAPQNTESKDTKKETTEEKKPEDTPSENK